MSKAMEVKLAVAMDVINAAMTATDMARQGASPGVDVHIKLGHGSLAVAREHVARALERVATENTPEQAAGERRTDGEPPFTVRVEWKTKHIDSLTAETLEVANAIADIVERYGAKVWVYPTRTPTSRFIG